ncbi:CPBP family intramembrane glutamic endopeptidase [Microbacterium proteolyticum]|uniref:CPBP family intramembrane glutamic endopeptidase n=1 Tax=Microbacterium proteolyticum TaxID=1572644 RepID=UPI001FAD7A5E|nr:CPBP family intramembrane glutamic endopeptidase [Microbacterium proteolyticum]
MAVLSLVVTARLAPQQPEIRMLAMWVALIAVMVVGFPRGGFDGLWAWRSVDVLWGVAAGLALRLLQGISAGEQAFPFSATLAGSDPEGWWLQQALSSTLGGPFVEEFFFRGLIVVLVFRLGRRAGGAIFAAVAGVLVSAVAFALWHAVTAPLSLSDGVQLGVVGATCAVLLLLTGRIWGAVIAHVVYNVSYLVLVVIGTTYR